MGALVGAVLAVLLGALLIFISVRLGRTRPINTSLNTAAQVAKETKENRLEETPASDLVDADPTAAVLRDQSVEREGIALRRSIADRLASLAGKPTKLGRDPGVGSADGPSP